MVNSSAESLPKERTMHASLIVPEILHFLLKWKRFRAGCGTSSVGVVWGTGTARLVFNIPCFPDHMPAAVHAASAEQDVLPPQAPHDPVEVADSADPVAD